MSKYRLPDPGRLAMHNCWITLGILGVPNIPLYILIGRWMFDDWDGFCEAIRYWITPDIISLFRGEYWDDWWESAKLGVFVGLCGGLVYGEYALIQKLFMK